MLLNENNYRGKLSVNLTEQDPKWNHYSPLDPLGPAGPSSPAGPTAPTRPSSPLGPLGPGEPMGPGGPGTISPSTIAPGGPGRPIGPCNIVGWNINKIKKSRMVAGSELEHRTTEMKTRFLNSKRMGLDKGLEFKY